jgi:hypothetical protein
MLAKRFTTKKPPVESKFLVNRQKFEADAKILEQARQKGRNRQIYYQSAGGEPGSEVYPEPSAALLPDLRKSV